MPSEDSSSPNCDHSTCDWKPRYYGPDGECLHPNRQDAGALYDGPGGRKTWLYYYCPDCKEQFREEESPKEEAPCEHGGGDMRDCPHGCAEEAEEPCAHESWDVTSEWPEVNFEQTPTGRWVKTRRCNDCRGPLGPVVEDEPTWDVQPAEAEPAPQCKFKEGCHRVIPCKPGCGAPWGEPAPRLLDCGFCYEENGEEVHPHPECPIGAPPQPERRPPYAVAYAVQGHLYEVALPGDATVEAVDGALVIRHGLGQVAGIVAVNPMSSKEESNG